MIKVFDELTSLSTDHEIINVTMDCLVKNISLNSEKVLSLIFAKFHCLKELQLLAKGSAKSKSILTSLVERKLPSLPRNIDSLLEWPMWQSILIVISKYMYFAL